MQVRPYRTLDNKIDGAVISYTDVNAITQALVLAEEAKGYAESIVAAIRHPLLVLDGNLRVVSASEAFYKAFHVNEKDTVGNLIYRLGNGQWGIPKLRSMLEHVLETGESFDDFFVDHRFESIGRQLLKISGRQITKRGELGPLALMQIEGLEPPEGKGGK